MNQNVNTKSVALRYLPLKSSLMCEFSLDIFSAVTGALVGIFSFSLIAEIYGSDDVLGIDQGNAPH